MNIELDAEADALYISLRERHGKIARTAEVGGDVSTMVDLDAEGNLLGIEVLSPQRPWPLAEILRQWEIPAADAAMLMGCYPCAYSFSVSPVAATGA